MEKKRPFAAIGFGYLAAMTAAFTFGNSAAAMLLGFFLIGIVVLWFVRKHLKPAFMLVAAFVAGAVACGVYFIYQAAVVKPELALVGKEAEVTGMVRKGQSAYLMTDSVDIPGAPQRMKLRLYAAGEDRAAEGELIRCRVRFDRVPDSMAEYCRRDGVFLYAYVQGELSTLDYNPYPIYGAFYHLQTFLQRSVSRVLPDMRGEMLKSLLFGDKSGLSARIKRDIDRSGISHVFAVSGMHLSILVQFLLLLLERFRAGRKIKIFVPALFVVLFMGVTGFSISVLRAGIMLLLALFGKLIFRQTDTVNSVGFAVFLIVLIDPVSTLSGALWLSAGSTCGIALCASPLEKHLLARRAHPDRMTIALAKTVSVSVCGYLSTLPILILLGMDIPLLGIFTNLLIAPVTELALVFALLTTLCSLLPFLGVLTGLLGSVFGLLALYVRWAAGLVAVLPFAVLSDRDAPLVIWLLGCVAGAAVLLFTRKGREYWRHGLALSVLALSVALFSNQLLARGVTQITLYPEGGVLLQRQDQAVLYALPTDRRAAGSLDFMLGRDGVDRLELVFCFENTLSGVSELRDNIEIGTLVLPEAEKFTYQRTAVQQYLPLSDMEVDFDGELTLQMACQPQGGACLLSVGPVRLLSFYGDCDILKLPENFLSPDFVLFPEKGGEILGLQALHADSTIQTGEGMQGGGIQLDTDPLTIRCRGESYILY